MTKRAVVKAKAAKQQIANSEAGLERARAFIAREAQKAAAAASL